MSEIRVRKRDYTIGKDGRRKSGESIDNELWGHQNDKMGPLDKEGLSVVSGMFFKMRKGDEGKPGEGTSFKIFGKKLPGGMVEITRMKKTHKVPLSDGSGSRVFVETMYVKGKGRSSLLAKSGVIAAPSPEAKPDPKKGQNWCGGRGKVLTFYAKGGGFGGGWKAAKDGVTPAGNLIYAACTSESEIGSAKKQLDGMRKRHPEIRYQLRDQSGKVVYETK